MLTYGKLVLNLTYKEMLINNFLRKKIYWNQINERKKQKEYDIDKNCTLLSCYCRIFFCCFTMFM